MANNCNGLILLQNYPLYSISTTSRRYERDRRRFNATTRIHQTCGISKKQKQVAGEIVLCKLDNSIPTQLDKPAINQTQILCHTTHVKRYPLSSVDIGAAKAKHNNDINMPNKQNKQQQQQQQEYSLDNNRLEKKTLKSNYHLLKRGGNIKRIVLLTITFISLANIADEGRVLCDKVYSQPQQQKQQSTTRWNKQQARATAFPYEQSQQQTNNLQSDILEARTTDANVDSVYPSPAVNWQAPQSGLMNQLMLLLAPLMNSNRRQQQQGDKKLLQDRNLNNGDQQHQSNGNLDSSFIPVTTAPITATLLAPNLFQSVTPSTFQQIDHHSPNHYSHNSRVTQFQDEAELIGPPPSPPPVNVLNTNFNNSPASFESSSTAVAALQQQQQQSDLAVAMSELNPSLVFSIKDTLDTQHTNSNYLRERMQHQHQQPATGPYVQLLPLLDREYTTSASDSWPMMVARNSVANTMQQGETTNLLPSLTNKDNTNKQLAKVYSRKLRSLHQDKVANQQSKHSYSLAKPRGIMWDMATDTSLGVTLLHMMDRASFALPLGFFLMPIIQMMKSPSGGGLSLARLLPARASHRSVDYEDLVKRIDYVDKLLSKALRPSHRGFGVVGRKR